MVSITNTVVNQLPIKTSATYIKDKFFEEMAINLLEEINEQVESYYQISVVAF